MYDNDRRTGTDYEYNHSLDEYLYQKPKMLIKVKYAPDTELTGDAGTSYIVTEHKGFIETLESITDYKVMPCFLDANTQYYTELVKTPSYFDKEIDLTPSFMAAIEDDEIDFMDKIVDKRLCIIPKIKDL